MALEEIRALCTLRLFFSKLLRILGNMAFLDACKAFTVVWHESLFVKLHKPGVAHALWFLLVSWYRQCTSAVVWGNCCSRSFNLHQGVCQGAVLSPLLYTLFVDDLYRSFLLVVMVHLLMVFIVMHADDLVLIDVSSAELQALLDITTAYAARWRYTCNATKCFVLVFSKFACSYSVLHAQCHWHIGSQDICECDDI